MDGMGLIGIIFSDSKITLREYVGSVEWEPEEVAELFAVMFSHIIIPNMPTRLKEIFDKTQTQKRQDLKTPSVQAALKSGEKKLSKIIPTALMEIKDNDPFIEMLRLKGVTVEKLDSEKDYVVHEKKKDGNVTLDVSGKYTAQSLVNKMISIHKGYYQKKQGYAVFLKIDSEIDTLLETADAN